MTKTDETGAYARVGVWWILLSGFRDDPRRAVEDLAGGVVIFAILFAILFFDEILRRWGGLG